MGQVHRNHGCQIGKLEGARAAPHWWSSGLLECGADGEVLGDLQGLEKWLFSNRSGMRQCFNNQHNCSDVYHLNISAGLTTTEEPIMCFHEVLWKGMDISQDLHFGYYDCSEIKE